MSRFIKYFGVVLIFAGLWILVFPDQILALMDWESQQGKYVAATIRAVTGLLVFLSASSTRYPKGLRIFGGLVLLAGLGILFISDDSWQALIHWSFVENPGFYRVVGSVGGVLLGAFFVHAASPRVSDEPGGSED